MNPSPVRPTVGRIVHYVSFGTPGGEYTSQCRAVIVAGVPGPSDSDSRDEGMPIDLVVLNPTGVLFNRCKHDDGAETPGDPNCPSRTAHGNPHRYCACGWIEASHRGGTWHWPERAE